MANPAFKTPAEATNLAMEEAKKMIDPDGNGTVSAVEARKAASILKAGQEKLGAEFKPIKDALANTTPEQLSANLAKLNLTISPEASKIFLDEINGAAASPTAQLATTMVADRGAEVRIAEKGYGQQELGFRESLSKAIFGGLAAKQMGKTVAETVDINGDKKMDVNEAQALGAHIQSRIIEIQARTTTTTDKREKDAYAKELDVLTKVKDIPDAELIKRYSAIGIEMSPEAAAALKLSLKEENRTPEYIAQKKKEALAKTLDTNGDGTISKEEAEKNTKFLADIAGTSRNLSDAEKKKLKENPQSVIDAIERDSGLKLSPEAAKIFTDTAKEAVDKPRDQPRNGASAAPAGEKQWWEMLLEFLMGMFGIKTAGQEKAADQPPPPPATPPKAAAAPTPEAQAVNKPPEVAKDKPETTVAASPAVDPKYSGFDPNVLAQIHMTGAELKSIGITVGGAQSSDVQVQAGAGKVQAEAAGLGTA